MPRLVNADSRASRERQIGQQAPALFAHRLALNRAVLHFLYERAHILAHEIELVACCALSGMERDLRWRQRKDQPAAARIDMGQLQYVAQEPPVGRVVTAIDTD